MIAARRSSWSRGPGELAARSRPLPVTAMTSPTPLASRRNASRDGRKRALGAEGRCCHTVRHGEEFEAAGVSNVEEQVHVAGGVEPPWRAVEQGRGQDRGAVFAAVDLLPRLRVGSDFSDQFIGGPPQGLVPHRDGQTAGDRRIWHATSIGTRRVSLRTSTVADRVLVRRRSAGRRHGPWNRH